MTRTGDTARGRKVFTVTSHTVYQQLAAAPGDVCPLSSLHEHLVSEYGRRPMRSSTDRTLTVPRTHNRFGDRSFAVAGPRLWISLPTRLWQICSYGQLRRYLKNHLFGIWEITAQCDAWFSALYKYSYLLTYLHVSDWWGDGGCAWLWRAAGDGMLILQTAGASVVYMY